jgi:hypothetical protein
MRAKAAPRASGAGEKPTRSRRGSLDGICNDRRWLPLGLSNQIHRKARARTVSLSMSASRKTPPAEVWFRSTASVRRRSALRSHLRPLPCGARVPRRHFDPKPQLVGRSPQSLLRCVSRWLMGQEATADRRPASHVPLVARLCSRRWVLVPVNPTLRSRYAPEKVPLTLAPRHRLSSQEPREAERAGRPRGLI